MSLIRMKIDIQQAIANGMKEYVANYNSLIFNEQTREFQGLFWFSKEIKISVKDNKMLFKIKLNEDRVSKLSEEDMKKIKENDIKSRTEDLIIQRFVVEQLGGDLEKLEEHTFSEELIEQIFNNEEEKECRDIEKLDKIKLKAIKDVFKNDYNLDFKINYGESFAYLDLCQDEITLNKKALNAILQTLEIIDTFIIAPQYNEEDDNVEGIRLFFGIDLSVKEE